MQMKCLMMSLNNYLNYWLQLKEEKNSFVKMGIDYEEKAFL